MCVLLQLPAGVRTTRIFKCKSSSQLFFIHGNINCVAFFRVILRHLRHAYCRLIFRETKHFERFADENKCDFFINSFTTGVEIVNFESEK